jgi:hypothetical protein
MAQQYADRAYLSMNGAKFADLQSANLNMDYRAKAVDSMTQDSFNVGYVKGNLVIDIDFEVAIRSY